jgi:hypothetical protein
MFYNYSDIERMFDDFKKLYSELLSIKDTPDFKKYGFAVGGPYNAWLLRVQELENMPASNLLFSQKGVLAVELELLGLAYVESQGKETEQTKHFNNTFNKAMLKKDDKEDAKPISEISRLDEIKKDYELFGKWRIVINKSKMDYILDIYKHKKSDDYVSVYKYDPRHNYKFETLRKDGDRYYVKESNVGEFYIIDGNKEMTIHDEKGNLSDIDFKCYKIN